MPDRHELNELIDPVLGWGLSKAGDVAISSWGAYRMLFAPAFGGASREWFSRTRASAAFFNARRTVPAYREFLQQHGAENPQAFEDIPPMDKANYIKRWPLEMLCQGGKLPTHASGSTTRATFHQTPARTAFDTRPTTRWRRRPPCSAPIRERDR